jgi:dTDP-4-amino-4,6-dideoxygalactose transaminase
LNVRDLEDRLTAQTRAIIPVHTFGLSADMDPLMDFARRHDLAVIEDAACALGAVYVGRHCGTIGHMGCFSFHPRKSITTGEGGMIVTGDEMLAERIRLLRSHGGVRQEGAAYLRFEAAGFNYRLSDLQAAVGVAQMGKFEWVLERKRELACRLTELLRTVKGITPPFEPAGCLHTFQSYVVMLDDDLDRDQVIAAMRRRDVETTLGTYALHAQPFFQRTYGYTPGDLPGSYRVFRQSLTLPLYPQMEPQDPERVVTALESSIREVSP